jgi:glycerophosphoryl diester phosphodiesterase
VSPTGNVVAVSCHNCYRADLGTPDANLAGTLDALHEAQAADADLLELDVEEAGGTWYVGHDDPDDNSGAQLADVLADPGLLAGNQLLYVEIKERDPEQEQDDQLLSLLFSAGYAVEGRDVIIRTFHALASQVDIVRGLLDAGEWPEHAPHVRLQLLYERDETTDFDAATTLLDTAVTSRVDGVEFDYESLDLRALLDAARQRALGTNVWTFTEENSAAECRVLRGVTDAMTTDGDPAACREAIKRP